MNDVVDTILIKIKDALNDNYNHGSTHKSILKRLKNADFVDFVFDLNDIRNREVKFHSWAFKHHFDFNRLYVALLKKSLTKIELYSELFSCVQTTISEIDYLKAFQFMFNEEYFNILRSKRNELLAESDKYALVDFDFKAESRLEWLEYRQKLRDLPQTVSSPFAFEYPEKPKF